MRFTFNQGAPAQPAVFADFELPWAAAARALAPELAVPSARSGIGRMAFDGGATFRVWAPFADGVAVVGTWNSSTHTADPLASEGNGFWSADVPGPKVGDLYKFVIRNGDQVSVAHESVRPRGRRLRRATPSSISRTSIGRATTSSCHPGMSW